MSAPTLGDDLATYHDLRVCIGLENVEKDGQRGFHGAPRFVVDLGIEVGAGKRVGGFCPPRRRCIFNPQQEFANDHAADFGGKCLTIRSP